MFLSTAIGNANDFAQPFVAVFEVRNAEDVTVFVRLEAGVLAPGGKQAPRTFWVPDAAGEYAARAFVISGISELEVLSDVQSIQFSMQESSQPEPPVVFSLSESPSSSAIYQLKLYALEKISEDREKFGLHPLYLSQNIAAQKHAEDMLNTKTLSHWTTSGESLHHLHPVRGPRDGEPEHRHVGQPQLLCRLHFRRAPVRQGGPV